MPAVQYFKIVKNIALKSVHKCILPTMIVTQFIVYNKVIVDLAFSYQNKSIINVMFSHYIRDW